MSDKDFKHESILTASKLAALKNKVKEKVNLQEDLFFIDLFCGAGGLSAGLELAGFKCAFGTDMDKTALETFALNHKHATNYCGPISELTPKKILAKLDGKKIHLLVGGPPCQGFSTIGKGDPDDEKNSLFVHYCRILKIVNPEFFIFENVTGLLARKNQNTLDSILKKFKALGYRVKAKVLEAQHFGVPQRRKRTILLGTRLEKELSFPKPKFEIAVDGVYIPSLTLADAINSLRSNNGEIFNHDEKKVSVEKEVDIERLKYIPEGGSIRYKKDEDEFLPAHLKLGVDWENMREGRLREAIYCKLARNKPAPTINTQNRHLFHPVKMRKFTIRELASIQSFPSDFIFYGAHKSQLKQIGNAVPPLLAKALGEEIIRSYQSDETVCESSRDLNEPTIDDIRSEAFIYDNLAALKRHNQKRSVAAAGRRKQ